MSLKIDNLPDISPDAPLAKPNISAYGDFSEPVGWVYQNSEGEICFIARDPNISHTTYVLPEGMHWVWLHAQ